MTPDVMRILTESSNYPPHGSYVVVSFYVVTISAWPTSAAVQDPCSSFYLQTLSYSGEISFLHQARLEKNLDFIVFFSGNS